MNSSKGIRPPRRLAAAAAMLALTVGLGGCAANEFTEGTDSALNGTLFGDGASSQTAAQAVWIAAFQTEHARTTIEYNPVGSGSGREAFRAGANSFVGSDRPFHIDELDGRFLACTEGSDLVEFPAYVSPIAIAFNVDGVRSLTLDTTTIARIFAGEITRWNDPALIAQNPDAALPDAEITPVHRGDDSGVTENFTDYLSQASPAEWPWTPSGVWPIAGGEAANQTSGMVTAISTGIGTIGYLDASRIGELSVVAVGTAGTAALPEAGRVADTLAAARLEPGRAPGDIVLDLDPAASAQVGYPIMLVSYLIACEQYEDADAAVLAREYLGFVVSDAAQQRAQQYAGSAPLPPNVRDLALEAIARIR